MRTRLWIVGGAGAAACVGAMWLAAHQPAYRPTEPDAALTLVVGASLLGCGLASWRARPENRLGPAMIATGFAWFAGLLSEASVPWVYTLGSGIQYLWVLGVVYLLLSFPSGRLSRPTGRLMLAGTVLLVVTQVAAMLYGNKTGLRCPGCPTNVIRVFHDNRKAQNWLNLQRMIGAVLETSVIVLLVRRWWQASPAHRREIAPVVVAGCATLAALVWTVSFDLLGDPLGALPAEIWFYTTATVPVALLYVMLQRRLARGMVAGLVVELGEPHASTDLREALARALGDPSLQLAFWLPAERGYIDADGLGITLPKDDGGRRSTIVARDGEPIAALLHDPVLEHNAELVQSVCAAASLALENERLQAELRARLADLQASRARLVDATDTERRRIERDLHDGTQQRLVSIAMSLGLLQSKLPPQAEARPIVTETREALALALAELRELTHGINPPLLAERGLAAALDELCRRAGLPTRLVLDIDRRLPDRIETAAYFVASEALTNAAKHSHGNEVQVLARDHGRTLTIDVADDGIGGATAAGGSGLRGLADRVEALGGSFTVSSPPGRGTTIRAEIPCA